ncbi:MAG TPA: hypothetical protein VNI01_02810 [Elusimicrobiota bacterium]|nr:hypothetical protein [Elusimicrobiota bacterium]
MIHAKGLCRLLLAAACVLSTWSPAAAAGNLARSVQGAGSQAIGPAALTGVSSVGSPLVGAALDIPAMSASIPAEAQLGPAPRVDDIALAETAAAPTALGAVASAPNSTSDAVSRAARPPAAPSAALGDREAGPIASGAKQTLGAVQQRMPSVASFKTGGDLQAAGAESSQFFDAAAPGSSAGAVTMSRRGWLRAAAGLGLLGLAGWGLHEYTRKPDLTFDPAAVDRQLAELSRRGARILENPDFQYYARRYEGARLDPYEAPLRSVLRGLEATRQRLRRVAGARAQTYPVELHRMEPLVMSRDGYDTTISKRGLSEVVATAADDATELERAVFAFRYEYEEADRKGQADDFVRRRSNYAFARAYNLFAALAAINDAVVYVRPVAP